MRASGIATLHFEIVAHDIIGYIASPDAVVLDYACGEALAAVKVADACSTLFLAEPAPGVRGRLIARFAPNTKIRVRSLEELKNMTEKSIDLVVMNSVVQYMTVDELDSALAVVRRLLKPNGRLVLGDILRPEVGMLTDVIALLRFAAKCGFLKMPLIGLASTALLRLSAVARPAWAAALQREGHDRQAGKIRLQRLARALQYRPQSLADDVRGAPRTRPRARLVKLGDGGLGLMDDQPGSGLGSPPRDRR